MVRQRQDDAVAAGLEQKDLEDLTEVRVELTEEGERTRMVMTHLGVPADSPGATGWAMAFDKLEVRVSATR